MGAVRSPSRWQAPAAPEPPGWGCEDPCSRRPQGAGVASSRRDALRVLRQLLEDRRQRLQRLAAGDEVVVQVHLHRGGAAVRREAVLRRRAVVDDPVHPADLLADQCRGAGWRDAAGQQHRGGIAPCSGRLRVGPAALEARDRGGQAGGDIGAERLVRALRRLHRDRAGAARQCRPPRRRGGRGNGGDAPLQANRRAAAAGAPLPWRGDSPPPPIRPWESSPRARSSAASSSRLGTVPGVEVGPGG